MKMIVNSSVRWQELGFLDRFGLWTFAPSVVVVVACGGGEKQPATPPPAPATTSAPQAPPAQAIPVAPAPATTPTLSQPAGLAFPCQTEAQCLAHRCNFDVGKCVWPCQTNHDCQPGFQCVPPACLPAPPQ